MGDKIQITGEAPGLNGMYTSGSQTIAISGNYVLPAGTYLIDSAANIEIQRTTDGTTWVQSNVPGNGGFVISDGSNIRLLNTSTSAAVTAYWAKYN